MVALKREPMSPIGLGFAEWPVMERPLLARSGRSPICRLRLNGEKSTGHSTTAMFIALTYVNERRNGTLDFHPKGTPMLRLAGAVALAPAQLVGIAQPGRTRER